MTKATKNDIEQLIRRAVNSTTRAIASRGIELTHEQADSLGEEVLEWMQARLGLRVESMDTGVCCMPTA